MSVYLSDISWCSAYFNQTTSFNRILNNILSCPKPEANIANDCRNSKMIAEIVDESCSINWLLKVAGGINKLKINKLKSKWKLVAMNPMAIKISGNENQWQWKLAAVH